MQAREERGGGGEGKGTGEAAERRKEAPGTSVLVL